MFTFSFFFIFNRQASGLFVARPVPFFAFTERGFSRVHELHHKGGDEKRSIILSLDELNVGNCRRGFVRVADNGVIRMGELAPAWLMNFDSTERVTYIFYL